MGSNHTALYFMGIKPIGFLSTVHHIKRQMSMCRACDDYVLSNVVLKTANKKTGNGKSSIPQNGGKTYATWRGKVQDGGKMQARDACEESSCMLPMMSL